MHADGTTLSDGDASNALRAEERVKAMNKKSWAVHLPWQEGGQACPRRIAEVCEEEDEARERANADEGAEVAPAPRRYDVWLAGEEGDEPSRMNSRVSWEEASKYVAEDPERRVASAHRTSGSTRAGIACACMLAACLAGGAAYTAWRVAQPEPETPESAMRQPADEEARPASESRDDPEAALEAIEAKREEAEKAAKEAGGEVEYDSAAGEYAVKDSSGKQVTSVPSGSGSGSLSSGSSSSDTNGGSSSSGGTGGGSGEPEKPAHVHSWVNDYESRYVVDEPAWDEPVYETVTWCNDCGMAVDVSHFEQYPHSYSVKQIQVDTIHHAEQGHYEDVCVGKHCSGCGAKG